MKDKIQPKPKGTREKQNMYFHNYQWYLDASDDETGSLRQSFKHSALNERARGLILQNPRPEDLPKYKIH